MPQYQKLAPGQPPQRIIHAPAAPAYCIQCGKGVCRLSPQLPMCVGCWDTYRDLPIWAFRDDPTSFCHGCGGEVHGISFGSPLCGACEEIYACRHAA